MIEAHISRMNSLIDWLSDQDEPGLRGLKDDARVLQEVVDQVKYLPTQQEIEDQLDQLENLMTSHMVTDTLKISTVKERIAQIKTVLFRRKPLAFMQPHELARALLQRGWTQNDKGQWITPFYEGMQGRTTVADKDEAMRWQEFAEAYFEARAEN